MSSTASVQRSLDAFRVGAIDVIEEGELRRKLERAEAKGIGLRVKLGLDPSSPDLHFGHAVLLKKLRDLQELGHRIVLIVGTSTAMVGDPSGRNKLRPQLTRAEVDANLLTYTKQAELLLDMTRVEVRQNSEWFDAMSFEDLLRLLGRRTVAQTLTREDFQKRMASEAPIGLHELIYPVMQGWDSVQVEADVELGGTDQLFNLLVGRDLQVQTGQEPQVVLTTPLINGLDGRKMSKSYGNAIGLTDPPKDIFGKTMRIVDEAMPDWYRLLTSVPAAEWKGLVEESPREAKACLAGQLVALLHGKEEAERQREMFEKQFVKKELPDDIPAVDWPFEATMAEVPLTVLLRTVGLAASGAEARRLLEQGGVKLDGTVVRDANAKIARGEKELLIQVGKRRFMRIRPAIAS